MSSRRFVVGLSVAVLTTLTALPASAQVGDFFCSTFSIGCEPPPPPPLAPAPIVEQPAPKKVRKARKAVPKRTAAKADPDKADAAAPK